MRIWFLPASLTLIAAILLWGGLIGPSFDPAVFVLVAARIRAGDMPYRDVWDHKPPGGYLTDAAVQSLLPWLGPWMPVWLLSVACAAALGLIVAIALRQYGYPRLAPWCALVATATAASFPISSGGGQTELIAALPASGALLLLLRSEEARAALVSGVLIGLALSISLQLAPAVIAAAIVIFAARKRWRRAALLTIGATAVPAAIAAWLFIGGAWPDAIDAFVVYNGAYRAANAAHPLVDVTQSSGASFLLMAGVFGIIRVARPASHPLFLAAIAWVGTAAAMFVAEARLESYYLEGLIVPLGVLAGPGLAGVARRQGSQRLAVTPALAQIVLVGAAVISLVSTAYWTESLTEDRVARANSARQAARWLQDVDGGSLMVWGLGPEIYYVSGRRPATRYVYALPLMTPGYATEERIAGVESDLARSFPNAVIDASSWTPGRPGGTVPLLRPGVVLTDGRNLDVVEPIRAFVRAHYAFATDLAGWFAYVRTGDAGDASPMTPDRARSAAER